MNHATAVLSTPTGAGIEARRFERFQLISNQLPGVLTLTETHRVLFATAIDVSRFGLGLLLAEKLPIDTKLALEIDAEIFPLRVVWVKQKGNRYRYGIEVTDKSMNLETTMFAQGLIDIDLDGGLF